LYEPNRGRARLIAHELFKTIPPLRATDTSILPMEQSARAALEIADQGYVMETAAVVLQGVATELTRDERVIAIPTSAQRGPAWPAATRFQARVEGVQVQRIFDLNPRQSGIWRRFASERVV
jgi:hypothetical protein